VASQPKRPKHILEAQQFGNDPTLLRKVFSLAEFFEKGGESDCMQGKILASLFYEPSTRTRLSFESAALRLGGRVIGTENAEQFSSVVKGESLPDTIRIISGYADVIALRHKDDNAAEDAARVASVPIINAGSGAHQHPTQALLDLYTIERERGTFEGLTVAFVGDLRHGRTVRSLAYLLGKFSQRKIIFASPSDLCVGQDIKDYLKERGVNYLETDILGTDVLSADVVYMTRMQSERHEGAQNKNAYEQFQLTGRIAKTMRNTTILHPLPRNNEILPEVDTHPNAAYFRQARNGLWVRMALLQLMFA